MWSSVLSSKWQPKQVAAAVTLLLSLTRWQVCAETSTSCPTTVSGKLPAPSVASGFDSRLVATGLKGPRGCIFDSAGHLLVVEAGAGVTALTLQDDGGSCLSVAKRSMVVTDPDLNHGITLSHDGSTLYASSPEAVYSWPYDAKSARTTGSNITVVANMTTSDHTTRTLLLSKKVDGTLVVTRGSTSNIDPEAEQLSTGHSQIKSFDVSDMKHPYDFNTDGKLLGWGLRNDVGIDEEPIGGGLYSVENSADQVMREGSDIHQNNPGEKLNFLGYLNGKQSPNQGGNFGYPQCFAAWDAQAVPNFNGQVGTQFSIGTPNATVNDTYCQDDKIAPRLVFQAHMAPLTLLFNSMGTQGWVTFHGSWDRTNPVGYKVGVVQYADGSPVEKSTSQTALMDIVTNQDNSKCPDNCFRPAGLAWDTQGRLFFTSDSSGEVYVITSKANNGSVNAGMPSSSTTGSSSGSGSSATGASNSLGSSVHVARAWGAVGLATLVAALMLI